MNDKMEGIVLQALRYGDTSLIVKVFTRNHGLQSYMVKGALNRGSKTRAALFQNMNIIQFVETGQPKGNALNYLKDVQLSWFYQSIPNVLKKSTILLYISELLSKTLIEQEQNEALYDFIVRSMQWLDLREQDYANFPLFFTLELTRHLGFYPQPNHQAGFCFDMMEGSFAHDEPLHPYYFDAETAVLLSKLLDLGIEETCNLPLRVNQRRQLLDGLIVFMRIHAPVMKELHSHAVLKSVLE